MAARMELWKLIFVCFLKICLIATVWQSVSVSGNELYRCPKVSSGHMFDFRQKCYRFVPHDMQWNEAQVDCQVKGGNLVHIKDQATQNFIYTKAKHTLAWDVNGMWIGAHDQRTSGRNVYEWVKGSRHWAGEQLSWANWANDQPSCGLWCNEECAQMRLTDYGRWHDASCSSSFTAYRYCCMYEMGPRTTTTARTTRRRTRTTMKPTTTTTTMKPTTTTTTMKPTTTTKKPTNRVRTKVPKSTPKRQQTGDSDGREISRTTTRGEEGSGLGATQASSSSSSSTDSPNAALNAQQVKNSPGTAGGKQTLTGGEIAGLCIGFLCLLCLLAILLVVIRRRRKKAPEPSVSFSSETYNQARASSHQAAENICQPSHVHLEGAIGGHPDMTFGEESLQNNFNYSLRKGSESELSNFDSDEDHYDKLPYDNDLKVDLDGKESRPNSFKNDYLTAKSLRENSPAAFLNSEFDTGVKEKVRSADNFPSFAPGEAATSSDQAVCGKVVYQTPTFPARSTGQPSSTYSVNHGYESPRIPPTPLTTEEDAELPNLSRERTTEDNFYGEMGDPEFDTDV